MKKRGLKFALRPSDAKVKPPQPRRPVFAGVGRLRKVALLGGASTLRWTPWHDPSWELWAHQSCRHLCKRDPDLLWDLHPPDLWRESRRKTWDPKYYDWLKTNRVPIMMQDVYHDVPASMRYPFETMITEFPRGYMTNHVAYMVALALMEGVTHLGVFGCEYNTNSEYGPQRGSAEYWLGVAEGRGVQVCLPPTSDLLNKPSLLYGYESHPDGIRDPSYSFHIGPLTAAGKIAAADLELTPSNDPNAPPLRNLGVAPDPDGFERAMKAQKANQTWPSPAGAAASGTTTSRPDQPRDASGRLRARPLLPPSNTAAPSGPARPPGRRGRRGSPSA